MLAVKLLGSVILADFVTGLVHWFEDAYVHREMPLFGKWLGKVAEDNRLHHVKPRAFLEKSWWQSSWDLVLAAVVLMLTMWWLKKMDVAVLLFAILVANANQIHKWTHQSPLEKGCLVHRLQKLYILQTPREHGRHHSGEKDSHYCVITNFSNPILEKLQVWKGLEWMIERGLGVKRYASAA